ncbi:asparagine synthetase B family protein [Emcibacter sp.]|uniref:asparagine synthetase B family protein n=1 Tax=Emcibacter sp. TaxID=1979954 RepID=UPI002AA7392B|nr:asparagine synthase-related protein [Emcibacter sp.]
MSGISGWQGHAGDNDAAGRLIGEMAGCLIRGDHERHLAENIQTFSSTAGALAVVPTYGNGCLDCEGEFQAAVNGVVRWQNDVLAGLAAQKNNAAALIEGYRRFGTDVFRLMQGAWSAALLDMEKRETAIAIDRTGINSLCYACGPEGEFIFSTVTDAVKRFPGLKTTISPQSVYNYLYYFVVPSPTSIYDQMNKLEPAQFVKFSNGQVSKGFYWSMPYTTAASGNRDEWKDALWDVLDRSFEKTLSDTDRNQLGAFLSGGLDSSTVAGLMMKHNGGGKTYTIGFHESQFDESGYARLAAEHFKTDHHEYFMEPTDVEKVMENIADIYDEPYGNHSAVAAYYCAKMAKESGVSTLLAGDGGDEIFAGNERYVMMKKIEKYALIPGGLRKYFLEPILELPGMQHVPVVSKARSLARRYATPMPERLYSYSFISGVEPLDIFRPECREGLDTELPLELIRQTYHRHEDTQMLQRMMHMDMQITLADNDLRKVNQMCRLAGVDVHYPFLEDELVEFAASIPVDVMLPGYKLRDFFKFAMKGFLPDETLTKEKHGFGLPFMVWIHRDTKLNELVTDNVSDFKKRGYLENEFLDDVIASCSRAGDPGAGLAWDLAMLEMWLKNHC